MYLYQVTARLSNGTFQVSQVQADTPEEAANTVREDYEVDYVSDVRFSPNTVGKSYGLHKGLSAHILPKR